MEEVKQCGAVPPILTVLRAGAGNNVWSCGYRPCGHGRGRSGWDRVVFLLLCWLWGGVSGKGQTRVFAHAHVPGFGVERDQVP